METGSKDTFINIGLIFIGAMLVLGLGVVGVIGDYVKIPAIEGNNSSMPGSEASQNNSLPTIAAIFALIIVVPYFMWISYLGTKKNTNPAWYNNPFGLPKGSIRAIITLLFVIVALLSYQTDQFTKNQWLIGILGTIIGFYFGEASAKETNDKETNDKETNDKETNAKETNAKEPGA
jgi:hypothetical protein